MGIYFAILMILAPGGCDILMIMNCISKYLNINEYHEANIPNIIVNK